MQQWEYMAVQVGETGYPRRFESADEDGRVTLSDAARIWFVEAGQAGWELVGVLAHGSVWLNVVGVDRLGGVLYFKRPLIGDGERGA